MAEMPGQLGPQRRLDHPARELADQPARAGDPLQLDALERLVERVTRKQLVEALTHRLGQIARRPQRLTLAHAPVLHRRTALDRVGHQVSSLAPHGAGRSTRTTHRGSDRTAEEARRVAMAEQGKKPRNPPGGRDPFKPKPKAQRNFTDPDSRIMKTSDGSFHQCYNGQVVVDSAAQVIIACDAFDAAPDAQLLEPMLDQLAANLAAIDAALPEDAALLGDAGYLSAQNLLITQAHGLDAHLAAGRVKHTDPPASAPPEPLGEHATAKQLMARKLAEPAGAALYARRKTIVEPVFGQMQTVQDARHLRLRGKPAARAQHRFQCTIHNLLKLHRNGGLALIPTG